MLNIVEDAVRIELRNALQRDLVRPRQIDPRLGAEEYALPQLGLLPGFVGAPIALEAKELTPEQREEVLAQTERFRTELPQMLEEHKAIAAALEDLRAAAEEAGETEYARLAEEIGVHAKTEEQVLYPAALLIGDYAGCSVARGNKRRLPEASQEELRLAREQGDPLARPSGI